MDSETILKTLHDRLQVQRYANNTIKSYCGYAQIFLEYMNKYRTLNEIPIAEIEGFINEKVFQDNNTYPCISVYLLGRFIFEL